VTDPLPQTTNRKRWLILSHAFNMDGRAASQTITDKIPHFIEAGIKLTVFNSITGIKDTRFPHHQFLAWGPAAFRFDFRHWVANQYGRGLLDMFTMRHFKQDFTKLKVAIVGDIVHSRVAKSNIHALTALGCTDIRAIGPESLLPNDLDMLGVKVFHSMEEGLRSVDVVMTLRIQKERMEAGKVPEGDAFFRQFGLTQERLALAKPDAIVMHPGPMNRGVEIDSKVADGAQSVILKQVTFGIAVRMAVMSIVAGN